MSTWTPSTRRSSSATIRRCAASRWRSAAQARGVVAAASYEARKYRRALGHALGHRQAPLPRSDLRQAALRRLSRGLATRSARSSPTIRRWSSRCSLDEAYLDVTEDLKGIGIATRIAEEIRARIRAETGLTASAGVSYNKFLAKLASDQNKPDGLCVITAGQGRGLRRHAAGQALPRRRPEDRGEDGAARHRHRRRPARAEPRLPRPQFRQRRPILSRSRARHLPPPGAARPALQVDRRRGHVRTRI